MSPIVTPHLHTISHQQLENTNTTSPRAVGSIPCAHDQAYLSIVITVIPLWATLTTILVLVLIQFHRSSRATKIYDNCTKSTAHFIYHVELRTGDTSATYNRRRTTLIIDMFDDNQNTLARVSIPGHVIFGRKDTPVVPIAAVTEGETERFSELRCTRLWLYRAARLKRISTIRVTHSCLEPDARIMVFGIELKSKDPDKLPRQFFPVAQYISAYGPVTKPNACFDWDAYGSLTAMGGRISEPTSMIDDQLSLVDYALFFYLFCSILAFLSTYEILDVSFDETSVALNKGFIVGSISFIICFSLLLAFKYTIRHQYSTNIGLGFWGFIYVASGTLIIVIASAFWVYAAIVAYKELCSNKYDLWIVSMSVGALFGVLLALAFGLMIWLVIAFVIGPPEPYNFPEESEMRQSGGKTQSLRQSAQKFSKQRSGERQANTTGVPVSNNPMNNANNSWPNMAPVTTVAPSQQMPAAANVAGQYQQTYSPAQSYVTQQTDYQQQTPLMGTSPSHPQLNQPGPMQYKTSYHRPQGPYDTGQLPHQSNQYYQPPPPPPPPSPLPTAATQPPQINYHQQAPKSPNYHQQTQLPGQQQPGGGIKPTKKIGSTESTGSTYYQQVMKTKGGVKSISQYGEILKQQKRAHKKQ